MSFLRIASMMAPDATDRFHMFLNHLDIFIVMLRVSLVLLIIVMNEVGMIHSQVDIARVDHGLNLGRALEQGLCHACGLDRGGED